MDSIICIVFSPSSSEQSESKTDEIEYSQLFQLGSLFFFHMEFHKKRGIFTKF